MKAPSQGGNCIDGRIVAAQLRRPPRGKWSVVGRCSHGRPTVIETAPTIETAPALAQQTLFPTLYWLTCPWLVQYVDGLESAGGTDLAADRLAREPDLAAELLQVDAEYRQRRAVLAPDGDPFAGVGIAGQSDPLATKCLHAHVANVLAQLNDPIGREILAGLESAACPSDLCATRAPESA